MLIHWRTLCNMLKICAAGADVQSGTTSHLATSAATPWSVSETPSVSRPTSPRQMSSALLNHDKGSHCLAQCVPILWIDDWGWSSLLELYRRWSSRKPSWYYRCLMFTSACDDCWMSSVHCDCSTQGCDETCAFCNLGEVDIVTECEDSDSAVQFL